LLAATSIPELFQDVILVEPVARPEHDEEIRGKIKIASSTVARQDQWENRAVALQKFQKNERFFGRWNPSVLKRYLEHALESEQPVKLKCNKLHEASVFVQPHNRTSESYFRFSELFDESMTKQQHDIPLGNDHLPFRFLLILGNQSDSVVPEDVVKRFGFVKIDRSGHLITQENPLELASLISKHLTESKFPSCINMDTTFCKL
jgi:pimeloyl-ACP methyl ester carboxylesterase